MNYRSYIIIAVLIIIAFTDSIHAGEIEYSGYTKGFYQVNIMPKFYQDLSGNDISETEPINNIKSRINFSYIPWQRLSLNTSYELNFTMKNNYSLSSINSPSYRVDDLENPIYPNNSDGLFSISQNLDRLYVRFSLYGDFYIGRQPIAWGAGRSVNPTDILLPFSFDALDTEERTGVDAIRAVFPIGMMNELDLGYVIGYDFEFDNSSVYIRPKIYVLQTNLSLTVIKFRENWLYGFDLMRSIGGAGSWLEYSYTQADKTEDDIKLSEEFHRLNIGADYSFSDKFYGSIEYHYNGAGNSDPSDDLARTLENPAYTDGYVFFQGEHYIIPTCSYMFTPLLTGSGQIIANLSDNSVLIAPAFEYNIAQDIYMSLGGYIGIGKKSHFSLTDENAIKSEFGLYPDMIYLSFRYYY